MHRVKDGKWWYCDASLTPNGCAYGFDDKDKLLAKRLEAMSHLCQQCNYYLCEGCAKNHLVTGSGVKAGSNKSNNHNKGADKQNKYR